MVKEQAKPAYYRMPHTEQPAQKAPRASWWRRFTHRNVETRLDISRRRRVLKQEFPNAEWKELHDLAIEEHNAAHGGRGDYVDMVLSELNAHDMRLRLLAREL